MIFRNNLYFIDSVSRTEEDVTYQLHLNAEHVIYQAHFPGEPITPGVCLLQMGVELLSDAAESALEIDTVKNVKFLSVLHPEGQTVTVRVHHLAIHHLAIIEDNVKAQIDFTAGEVPVAKMSLLCRKSAK